MPSVEQDYVMRLIAELAAFLRRARDLVRLGRAREALDELREGCLAFVGLDARVLELLDARTVLAQLGSAEKAGAAAALFAAQGDAYESLGEPERAAAVRRRALELYLEMQLAGSPPDAEGVSRARELLGRDGPPLDPRHLRAAALLRGE